MVGTLEALTDASPGLSRGAEDAGWIVHPRAEVGNFEALPTERQRLRLHLRLAAESRKEQTE